MRKQRQCDETKNVVHGQILQELGSYSEETEFLIGLMAKAWKDFTKWSNGICMFLKGDFGCSVDNGLSCESREEARRCIKMLQSSKRE